MTSSDSTSEIVEIKERSHVVHRFNRLNLLRLKLKEAEVKSHVYHVANDLDRFVDATDAGTSPRLLGSCQMGLDLLLNDASKKPVRFDISKASGTRTSESVNLKHALRRLCISHASEMAAIRRPSKPLCISDKRFYASLVLETSRSCLSLEREKSNEISILPEKLTKNLSERKLQFYEACNLGLSCKSFVCPHNAVSTATNVNKRIEDMVVAEDGIKGTASSNASASNHLISSGSCKPKQSNLLIKTAFGNKECSRIKGKRESSLISRSFSRCKKVDEFGLSQSKISSKPLAATFSSANPDGADGVRNMNSVARKVCLETSGCSGSRTVLAKLNCNSRSREKGECSQSSKSSLVDCRSGCSISEGRTRSGLTANHPHMANVVAQSRSFQRAKRLALVQRT